MTKMPNYTSTTNACKLCKPMGAMLAFRGIEGAMPFLHGSQGCATYMRRYIISHFNEPMDIASSSLGEKHAVFGGGPNLKLGLNVTFFRYFFIQSEFKGGFIDMPDIRYSSETVERANQSFWFWQGDILFGVKFKIAHKNK